LNGGTGAVLDRRSIPLRSRTNSARLAAVLSILLLVPAVGCAKLRRHGKGGPDASAGAAASAAANAAATAGAGGATGPGAAPVVTAVATAASAAIPTTIAPAPSPANAAEHAAFEQAKRSLADIEGMVARNAVKDPAHPGEDDVRARCEAIEATTPKLAGRDDAETKAFLEQLKKTCSLDVPLLTATEALDQLRFASSQASRRLVCNLAEKDLAKARAYKPNDKRVRALDGRFKSACK